ncbi:conserved protein of unknown function [Rhodovastum atsumiense]|uniref:Uncharacterized protein n=1 Tax=Rhodovastum atsumiense TaxID=504468 RepID=A0A5M6IKU8_9PROT|nr:hypothetical protein [Rhodovastum atsumiense]KAA5608854.1 hypothetical protein F1189_27105 [Rhodovastum atsumiense]CAH2599316.1 conserved protein of unknown function [Rhodovastum atsumiense]
MTSSVVLAGPGNVVTLAAFRRPADPVAAEQRPPAADAYDRRQAIERLRHALPPGSLVYVVRRWFHPDNDWLVCDFFRIDAHEVICITQDVALATERFDPAREVGLKLHRSQRLDPLTTLIDGTLARLLHGEPGAVQHVVIA